VQVWQYHEEQTPFVQSLLVEQGAPTGALELQAVATATTTSAQHIKFVKGPCWDLGVIWRGTCGQFHGWEKAMRTSESL